MQKVRVSLTAKIVAVSMAVSFTVAFLVSGLLYMKLEKSLEDESVQIIRRGLENGMADIDQDLAQVENLVTWASVDFSVSRFLGTDRQPLYTTEPVAVSAYNALDAQLFSTSLSDYVCKALISTYDGRSISTGNYAGTLYECEKINSRPYFDELYNAANYSWIGLINETFFNFSKEVTHTTIPIIRPVRKLATANEYGWIYIALSADILRGRMAKRTDMEGAEFIWRIGPRYYSLAGDGDAFRDVTNVIEIPKAAEDRPRGRLEEIVLEGSRVRVVSFDSAHADWTIMQYVLPIEGLNEGIGEILLYALGMFLLFTILLYISISRVISRPIKRIVRRIQHVSMGDFSVDPGIEGPDEIGSIGRSINEMSGSISALMEEQLRVESTKRNLELSNLQKQINPHFIYNTLNTIKWMAVVRQADGIVKAIDTMVVLLRRIATDTRLRIPVSDELLFLESYIDLLRYQYGNTFSYAVEIDGPELPDATILKFSLQPIVENAIFHGLEPQEKSGELRVRVGREDGDVVITVYDNGKGMDAECIERLLHKDNNVGAVIKSLGVNNVDQRIRLEFGEGYGVGIDSVPGEYTSVTMRYPYIPFGKKEEPADVSLCRQEVAEHV